ncbi:MAG: MMPL family transporter [Candidatus Parvarchaeota archaeon]|jgi:RND superfamily putative drug exporter|nr:MMPL family transporter [Candidatus Parvarchaeota archaeon]MCL5106901.1 MMPL family transporter [Candidatus Parvarchaeota archaeon]
MEINLRKFSDIIDKHHKKIIILWIAIFLISIPLAIHLFSIVSYNITGSSDNSTSSGNNLQLIVSVSGNAFSNNTKTFFENISNDFVYKNITSLYSIEYTLLNSTYYTIQKNAQFALNSAYLKYNLTPQTVPENLNNTIIANIANMIKNELNSSSITEHNSSYGFIIGIIKGYYNSSPLYVINNYNFTDYPLVPNVNDTLTLINYNHTTMISTVNNSNYSFVNSYINKISKNYGVTSYVTGSGGLSSNIESETNFGTLLAIAIGILMVIIITGFIFRSPIAAFVPLMIYGVDVTIAFSVFYIIYHIILKSTVSFFDPALAAILMLGISTDYLVYMLYRFKQELKKNHRESVKISINGAGAAILVSGTTVILAYSILSGFNLAFLGSTGILDSVGVLIVLVSAVTFMPAILVSLGKRVFYPNFKPGFSFEKLFSRLAHFNYRNRYFIISIFIIFIAIAAYFFVVYQPGLNFLGLLPNSGSKTAFYVATNNFKFDPIDPMIININNSQNVNETAIYNSITSISGVSYAEVTPGDNSIQILTYLKPLGFSTQALNDYNSINNYLKSSNVNYSIDGLQVFLGSAVKTMNGDVPLLIFSLGAMVFIVLFIILFSVYTPLRLVLLIISNVIAANGVTLLIFHYILSFPFISIAQIFLITSIMGVGVDYDIFLVMRIREYVKMGKSNFDAIKMGLVKSGPVVASIGVIFSVVFLSLVASGVPIIEEVGFIVAIGILIDSVISVLFIVPSIMFLLQKYNWWPGLKKYEHNK